MPLGIDHLAEADLVVDGPPGVLDFLQLFDLSP
jgi:hypothetical protein